MKFDPQFRLKFRQASLLLTVLATAGLVAFSCRPAAYEIVKPKKSEKVTHSETPVTPPETKTEAPLNPPGSPGNLAPTAHIEVIWNGTSVTKVHVNQPTTLRPSWDTLDPDYIGRTTCANAGIVKAEYGVGAEASPVADRPQGCENLAVPYTFTRTGDIEITLKVTSLDNQSAYASMILTVVDDNTPVTGDGGFTITADPMIVGIGGVVTFTGHCALQEKYSILWDFADGANGAGIVVTHTYKQVGQYKVTAVCTGASGKSLTATVTIVCLDHQVDIPNRPPVTTPTDDPPPPGTTPPGQTDQNRPGQGDPRQQDPGQKPGQQSPPGQMPQQMFTPY